MNLPFTQADVMALERYNHGLARLRQDAEAGEINEDEYAQMAGQIEQYRFPLAQRQQMAKQAAEAEMFEGLQRQSALGLSLEHANGLFKTKNFLDRVVPFMDPVSGSMAYLYEQSPGNWAQVELGGGAGGEEGQGGPGGGMMGMLGGAASRLQGMTGAGNQWPPGTAEGLRPREPAAPQPRPAPGFPAPGMPTVTGERSYSGLDQSLQPPVTVAASSPSSAAQNSVTNGQVSPPGTPATPPPQPTVPPPATPAAGMTPPGYFDQEIWNGQRREVYRYGVNPDGTYSGPTRISDTGPSQEQQGQADPNQMFPSPAEFAMMRSLANSPQDMAMLLQFWRQGKAVQARQGLQEQRLAAQGERQENAQTHSREQQARGQDYRTEQNRIRAEREQAADLERVYYKELDALKKEADEYDQLKRLGTKPDYLKDDEAMEQLAEARARRRLGRIRGTAQQPGQVGAPKKSKEEQAAEFGQTIRQYAFPNRNR